MQFQNTIAFAKEMDEKDPLKKYREQFYLPNFQKETIRYFTGNSLGLQPNQRVNTFNAN